MTRILCVGLLLCGVTSTTHAIPLALLFFNIGVEAGQLLFIAVILGVWAVLERLQWAEWVWRVPVYAIGSLAAFWTIERIAQFLS